MSTALSVLVAIFLYDPTRLLLVVVTDKYLFQKKESIKVVLNRLTQKLLSILDLGEAAGQVLGTLRETMRIESGALIARNPRSGYYEMMDSFGIVGAFRPKTADDELIRYFTADHPALNLPQRSEKPTP